MCTVLISLLFHVEVVAAIFFKGFANSVSKFPYQVLRDLGLLGLRIQRMPSNPGVEFALPSDYEYTTVSSSQ
jgi:hypothetical protein